MLKKEKKQLPKKGNYTAAIAVAYKNHVIEHASRPNQISVHTSTLSFNDLNEISIFFHLLHIRRLIIALLN